MTGGKSVASKGLHLEIRIVPDSKPSQSVSVRASHDAPAVRRVMIVDDSDATSRGLAQLFRQAGYEPSTFKQGLAALEHARRQILAQTFAERQIFPRTQVSLTEQEKYYKAHPALFEERKVYRLTVYTIHTPDMTDLLSSDLNATRSTDQVRDVLNKHGIRYEVQLVNAPAEDLPLDKISQFANAKVGDLLTATQPGNKVLLISVVSLEDKPLTFERAKPTITAYLTKERNTQAVEDHLKLQRSGARISYLGEFSKYSTARVE